MSFYDLDKEERVEEVKRIALEIREEIKAGYSNEKTILYFSDQDTYIRKTAYIAIGRFYKGGIKFREAILNVLTTLFNSDNEKIRQTVINAAGEIGMMDFPPIVKLMEQGLFDAHHSVRNAVIGSIKKMGKCNPVPTLAFAQRYLHHDDFEIRREICHGIELRGRTHPEDILPMLKQLQFDKKPRVRKTLVHVLGQIAYKKGCLATVIQDLKTWENKELVKEAIEEIIDVHERYKNFTVLTQAEAIAYIDKNSK